MMTELHPHLYAAMDRSKVVRKGYLTKEDTDRAVLLTGGILAGGVLVILGGLVFKAVRKADEDMPERPTGAGIRASHPGVATATPGSSGYVPPIGFATHSVVVTMGDSPWRIAQRMNMAGRPNWWAELKNANPDKAVDARGRWVSLKPGETIVIPLEGTSGPSVTMGMWSETAVTRGNAPGDDEGPFAA